MLKNRGYRYFILVVGVFLQFTYGIAYVWSVFQPFAKERFHMDTASANMPFGIFLGFFPLGNIIGGYLQKKLKSVTLIISGSGVMCFGLLLTAYVPVDQGYLLSLTYGIISSLGCGIAYNTSLATIQKWFPDKRGMATGLLICSSGLFGIIMNRIAYQELQVGNFQSSMTLVASILIFICFTFGWFMRAPKSSFHVGDSKYNQQKQAKHYTPREMIKTKQYYILACSMMFAVPAYFLINPMLLSLGIERGLSDKLALSGVFLLSVMNTLGRLLVPWCSDFFGRKSMISILFLVNMTAIFVLTRISGLSFLVCIALVAFSYGGFMGLYPTMSTDFFGSNHNGINYGFIMLGYAISSIGCPFLAKSLQRIENGTSITFVIAAIASLFGLILIYFLKKADD